MMDLTEDPRTQSCVAGSVVLNGEEIPISEETTGVTHLLEEIRSEHARLVLLRAQELSNEQLPGPKRTLVSARQCVACFMTFTESESESGARFMHVYQPGKLFGDPPPPDPRDRAEPAE